jgi:hypothetical protein
VVRAGKLGPRLLAVRVIRVEAIVEEFEKDGVVYDKDGVKVIAFTVDHGAAIKPAVGYRIEYLRVAAFRPPAGF